MDGSTNGQTMTTDIQTALNGKVSGSGNIGNDKRPIKIVNGVATIVDRDLLQTTIDLTGVTAGVTGYPTIWLLRDQNGTALMEFKLYVRPDGGCNFYVRARNSGGTMTDINIAAP